MPLFLFSSKSFRFPALSISDIFPITLDASSLSILPLSPWMHTFKGALQSLAETALTLNPL